MKITSKRTKKAIRQWLRERNISFGKKTKDSEIAEFFERVRPYTTEHELVRIGDDGDGGYLLPDDLDGINACFSPGVSIEVHFELSLAQRGIRSFLADYSVESLPIQNPLFDFDKKFLGMDDDSMFMTLESWIASKATGDTSDLILEMDIEGAEYEVIFDTSHEILNRFRIIIIEFHRLDALLDRYGYKLIDTAFRKLLRNFEIVHIHPNNLSTPTKYKEYLIPSEMEFTFLRKDRISEREHTTTFPHELDSRNMEGSPDLVLPDCWFSSQKS